MLTEAEKTYLVPIWELDGRIVVLRATAEVKQHGLHLPTESRKAPPEGRVVAVSEGVKSVKVGDWVMVQHHQGMLRPGPNGATFVLVDMREVYAKVDPSKLDEMIADEARRRKEAEEIENAAPVLDGLRSVPKLPAFDATYTKQG